MILYKDFESLFEKFCIMTVDGNLSDDEAFKVLSDKTTKDLMNLLQIRVYNLNNDKKQSL